MQLKIVITLMITLFFSGCFKEDGQIRITSNIENAIIYIDGDKRGMTGDGYTTIIIEEGDHEIRVYKEKNKEWFYEGKKNIFVGANSSVKIKIDADEQPTEYRIERLKREKREMEERLKREKREREERLKREKREREKRLAEEETKRLLKEQYFMRLNKKNGIFADYSTKLIWQDTASVKVVKKSFLGATKYCENLLLEEFDDWRVPDITELEDLNKKKNKLKNPNEHYFWSSVVNNHFIEDAWYFDFYIGKMDYISKESMLYVRCVRNANN